LEQDVPGVHAAEVNASAFLEVEERPGGDGYRQAPYSGKGVYGAKAAAGVVREGFFVDYADIVQGDGIEGVKAYGANLYAAVYHALELACGITSKARLYRRELQDEEPAEKQYDQEPDDAGGYISCLADDQ
jgi:hypothetical protein